MREIKNLELIKGKFFDIKTDRGDFNIGLVGMNKKGFDVLINADDKINWDCFNNFYIPADEDNKQAHPYGSWPRYFNYFGNDTSFIQWFEKRETESFTWYPQKEIIADFSNIKLRSFSLKSMHGKTKIKANKNINTLYLSGNIENIDISDLSDDCSISLVPNLNEQNSSLVYKLPLIKNFRNITNLDICSSIIGQAIDCKSILQFKNLEHLSISGRFTNLEVLKEFPNLMDLQLRYMQNLDGLPNLSELKKLNSFIAWNIEENRGKILRKELKELQKSRDMKYYSSVSQLKKAIWFTTEYGMPFHSWEEKNYKKAVKFYKNAVKMLKKVEDENEVKEIIIEFVKSFNTLENIETVEREDIATAVCQLILVPTKVIVEEEKALNWYDKVRDF